MANSAPSAHSNAGRPYIIQGGAVMQLVPAPQAAYPQGVQKCNYKVPVGRWTGGIQLASGGLSVILGIANVVFVSLCSAIGTGIRTGLVFYTAAGILGIISGKNKSRCVIIAYMVMSILSSVAAAVAVVIFSIDASLFGYFQHYSNNPRVSKFIVSLLLIIALIELVTAIIAAAFCCAGTPECCCKPLSSDVAPVVHYIHYQAPPVGSDMPPGMVVHTTGTTQAPPGAANGNKYAQQPYPMVQDPAGQPPMQWQPIVSQPPVGQQARNHPTEGDVIAQGPSGDLHPAARSCVMNDSQYCNSIPSITAEIYV